MPPSLCRGVIERNTSMRSRLLFRALCVGAALLVPAGGLTVLGVGTAGANPATLVTTSNVKLGSFGTVTMVGTTLFTKTTAVGTKQIDLVTKQFQVLNTSIMILSTITLLITILTTSGTKKINKVGFKIHGSGTLKGTNFTGCSVTTLPAIAYAKTTALKWIATNLTLSGVSVSGSCTTKSVLTSDISGHKFFSTLTFSAA
jgi:hypothetical protein